MIAPVEIKNNNKYKYIKENKKEKKNRVRNYQLI